jgi:hypothetical protein
MPLQAARLEHRPQTLTKIKNHPPPPAPLGTTNCCRLQGRLAQLSHLRNCQMAQQSLDTHTKNYISLRVHAYECRHHLPRTSGLFHGQSYSKCTGRRTFAWCQPQLGLEGRAASTAHQGLAWQCRPRSETRWCSRGWAAPTARLISSRQLTWRACQRCAAVPLHQSSSAQASPASPCALRCMTALPSQAA